MRVAMWDIAAPLKDRLQPLVAPTDEFVEIPEAPPAPVMIDVLIASRFAAKDANRVRFDLLQTPGAGVDKIAVDAIDPAVWICNAYEHDGPIAEYVFAAMLDHTTTYGALVLRMSELGWGGAYFSRPPHGELAGKTIGLVGLGRIGAAIAQRAKAFDMTVMAVTASRRSSAPSVDWIATADRLPELLKESDFVVLACPLTEATRGMMAMREFRRMKSSALLVNISRAEVAVEKDLFAALKEGIIGGAVIDVWYRYPTSATDPATPARFPFESLANVRMTPHSSAWTDALWERRWKVFATNIERLRSGRPLCNVVRAPTPAATRQVPG